jgi:hypothetical protein
MTATTTPAATMYANLVLWSDVFPYEVTRVVSDKCMEVRAMDAVLADDFSPETIPGGFMGHTVNNGQQKWVFMSNESTPIRIRKRKDGQWYSQYGRHVVSDAPSRFHDYNF